MKQTAHREQKVAFTSQGKGPAVVLLHGFCEDSTIWDEFKTDLIEAQYRVVCVDLPGFGQSDLPVEPSIDAYADAVLAVVRELEIDYCVLIGHSMGGYTALAVAEKHPEILLGLGLFHSHPYADSEEKKEARRRSIQFIRDQGHILFVKQLIPGLFAPGFARSNTFTVDRLIHAASAYLSEGIISGLEAMIGRPDRSVVLGEAAYPVLFIVGEEDKAIPADQSLSQTALPRVASVHILEKTGHMGMLEATKKTQKIVREFADYCTRMTKAG